MRLRPRPELVGGAIGGIIPPGISAFLMLGHMGYFSLAFYAASFLCYARLLYAPNLWLGRLASLLLASGIASHYFALLARSMGTHTVPYDDLYGSMSLFAWLLGVTYLG